MLAPTADWGLRNPITGMFGCCGRAASGQAAAPPMSVMNSRRLMPSMASSQANLVVLKNCPLPLLDRKHTTTTGRKNSLLQTFKNALQVLGWADGGNLRVDARFAANPTEWLRLAQEVVALSPDVILANSGTMAALREATATIPIVYVGGADPVGDGFVES
jgi:hypothetical protein